LYGLFSSSFCLFAIVRGYQSTENKKAFSFSLVPLRGVHLSHRGAWCGAGTQNEPCGGEERGKSPWHKQLVCGGGERCGGGIKPLTRGVFRLLRGRGMEMDSWIFGEGSSTLRDTPSRRDGISQELENTQRAKTVIFLEELGKGLKWYDRCTLDMAMTK